MQLHTPFFLQMRIHTCAVHTSTKKKFLSLWVLHLLPEYPFLKRYSPQKSNTRSFKLYFLTFSQPIVSVFCSEQTNHRKLVGLWCFFFFSSDLFLNWRTVRLQNPSILALLSYHRKVQTGLQCLRSKDFLRYKHTAARSVSGKRQSRVKNSLSFWGICWLLY